MMSMNAAVSYPMSIGSLSGASAKPATSPAAQHEINRMYQLQDQVWQGIDRGQGGLTAFLTLVPQVMLAAQKSLNTLQPTIYKTIKTYLDSTYANLIQQGAIPPGREAAIDQLTSRLAAAQTARLTPEKISSWMLDGSLREQLAGKEDQFLQTYQNNAAGQGTYPA